MAGITTLSSEVANARCGTQAASFDINVTAVETVLRRSALVALGEYRCPVEHPQFSGGGPQRCPFIAFPRSSVRITRLGARPLVYTPNTISLHNIGDIYCRDAISKDGERCDWIAVAPALLREIAALRGVVADDDRIFDVALAPATPAVYAAQRALFRSLRTNPAMSTLEVEESTLAIVDAVFRAARSRAGNAGKRVAIERRFFGRAPAIVEATLTLLATEYHGALSVDTISTRVHCSPGYLSRLFRRSTGFTLHEYQQQLRLRASLELLLDPAYGLSEVAMQLGFANHSHFTSAFRRQFGMTPTEFGRNASVSLLKLLQSAAA